VNIPLRKFLPVSPEEAGRSPWQKSEEGDQERGEESGWQNGWEGGRKSAWKNAWKISTLPFLLFILLPLLALLLRTNLPLVRESLQNEQVIQAIRLSMITSLISVAVTLLIGTPVAYYLAHRHYRFHHLVDTLVDLPTVLPPSVAGVALLMAFGRNGLLGSWFSAFDIALPFTAAAVVMAQTFVSASLYIKSAAIGLGAVDLELRHAAAIDGANRWQTLWFVTMPLSWVSILTGSALAWARALGEFGATIIFAGNFPGRTQTMPLAIYIGFEIDLRVALVLSVILVSLSFITILLVKWLLHRSITGSFRPARNA
jgi:molybdate transport system permease protein